ncbi:hypothetical protein H632_c772p0 [Helicosporidium sp. ATCC 50920]|nr:hypothetical protein H632_c772p0 [Helicosporidium sp. ATCC 50920]|eukprot:KDD75276.1 hypothetical protein H632_c772p0 [Helicosporidium sp. ATCC 50920]
MVQLPCLYQFSCSRLTEVGETATGAAVDEGLEEARQALSARVCGSPAVDGYSHVKPECLEQSPTAVWWNKHGQERPLVIHIEPESDYDGLAVVWGLGHKTATAQECGGICWEPDIHKHTSHDCWLKFTEGPAQPQLNMRGAIHEAQKKRHGYKTPERVPWVSGAVLPLGVELGNGTWGPRHDW